MAGSFTDFLERKLLDHVFGGVVYTPAAALYFATFSVTPDDTGGGTESTGAGYARVALANNSTTFPAASGNPTVKSNGIDIQLGTALGLWSLGANQVAWGIYDAASGGNLLIYGDLTPNQPILLGNVLKVGAGVLGIQLT